MGNVRKMGENRIIEQQRSDKNYRTTKKIRRKIRCIFFSYLPRKTELYIEQQGTVNNRTFVLLNFRSIIPALTVYIYIYGSLTITIPWICYLLYPVPNPMAHPLVSYPVGRKGVLPQSSNSQGKARFSRSVSVARTLPLEAARCLGRSPEDPQMKIMAA